MFTQQKGHRGIGMEGAIARWYARNTGRDLRRFHGVAEAVRERVEPGGRVLEVAPGPGYLAIELARLGYDVTAVDISRSFLEIAADNAARAGVAVELIHGDAAHLPLDDDSFDCAVCMAAFKNFSDPLGAINELHRVLRPGGTASIYDLRKEAPLAAIDAEVATMKLSPINRVVTRWTFRQLLLKRAYTREALERMAAQSRFSGAEIIEEGIGFELRLTRPR